MPYTIQLCLSEEAQSSLTAIFRELDSPVTRKGDRPHLSLSVLDAPNGDGITDLLEEISEEFASFPVTFSSVGFFPGPENIVFLAPVVTQQLIDIHCALHRGLDRLSITSWGHYRPGAWVPHVGVSMGSSAERDRILNSLLGQPLWGNHRISAIEFIYFSPGNLLHRVELKSKGARAAASPLAVALEKSGAG